MKKLLLFVALLLAPVLHAQQYPQTPNVGLAANRPVNCNAINPVQPNQPDWYFATDTSALSICKAQNTWGTVNGSAAGGCTIPGTSGALLYDTVTGCSDTTGIAYSFPGSVPTLTFTAGSAVGTMSPQVGTWSDGAGNSTMIDGASLSFVGSASQNAQFASSPMGGAAANFFATEGTPPNLPNAGSELWYFDQTAHRMICLVHSGANCILQGPASAVSGDIATFNGTSGAIIQDSGTTIASAGQPQFATYTISTNGTTVSARNNSTGVVDYSNADTAVVVNDILTAHALTGGLLYFKIGVYPINSMTAETATGCSNFGSSGNLLAYAFGFPSNTNLASVEWFIEGEANSVWQGESATTSPNVSGVIFNITSTAVSSVAAGSVLAGWWQRPVTNCTLVATNVSNHIRYKNIDTRFPTNQRGNEIAYANYFFIDHGSTNVTADFALSQNAIATGSAPVVGTYGSFGITSTISNAGNWQSFDNTYVTGYDTCYDFQSELSAGRAITAIYCNKAANIGRSSTSPITHPINIESFVDQENLAGITLGAQIAQGTTINIDMLDIELGAANWYARTTGAYTETNQGYTSGVWRVNYVTQGVGIAGAQALFSTGGQNIQVFQGAVAPSIALTPVSVTFTQPNASSLGLAWQKNGSVGATIASNAATCGTSGCSSSYIGRSFNGDQFAQATVHTVDANGVEAGVRYQGVVNQKSGYVFYCATGAMELAKLVNGTATNLGSNANSCVATDSLYLDAIGSTLRAFYCPVNVCPATPTFTAVDTTYTTGSPGIDVEASTDSLINFVGGSLPTRTGTDSIYSKPMIAPTYSTLTNCSSSASPAVCGSAAAGSVALPTNAVSSSIVVNTTAVTANSQIVVTTDDTLGAKLGVTCNSTVATLVGGLTISARTAGTSFTIANNVAVVTNPLCVSYTIVN
jgi:hypothetical protein